MFAAQTGVMFGTFLLPDRSKKSAGFQFLGGISDGRGPDYYVFECFQYYVSMVEVRIQTTKMKYPDRKSLELSSAAAITTY